MEIKIGFSENPRELAITLGDNHDEVVSAVAEGVRSEQFLDIVDAKGARYLINPRDVAYVEVGSANRPAVGFGGV